MKSLNGRLAPGLHMRPEPLSENQYFIFIGIQKAGLASVGGHAWHRTAVLKQGSDPGGGR
jgi:hypothetical protein